MSYLKYTGTGIRFNRANYLALMLFGLQVLIVWGFHGNCYGPNPTLRIGFLPLIRNLGIEFSSNFLDTYVCIIKSKEARSGKKRRRIVWNSEHLAMRYGKRCGGERSPEHWIFNHRLLGQHICC